MNEKSEDGTKQVLKLCSQGSSNEKCLLISPAKNTNDQDESFSSDEKEDNLKDEENTQIKVSNDSDLEDDYDYDEDYEDYGDYEDYEYYDYYGDYDYIDYETKNETSSQLEKTTESGNANDASTSYISTTTQKVLP